MTERTEGRKKFLHMMFTTAIEGGIGYWSVAEQYHWSKPINGPTKRVQDDLDGFYAVLDPISDDDWGVDHAFVVEDTNPPYYGQAGHKAITATQPLKVNIDVIERGAKMLVDKVIAAAMTENPSEQFSRKYLRQFVIQFLTDAEEGDSDADVADLVVQLGLFGKIVYA